MFRNLFISVLTIFVYTNVSSKCLSIPKSRIIDKAGLYCLEKNLEIESSIGISINNSNVTLDFKGFSITSKSENKKFIYGIHIEKGKKNIKIFNGTINNAIVGIDIGPSESTSFNILIKDLKFKNIGAIGIRTYGSVEITNNVFENIGLQPIDDFAYSIGISVGGKNVKILKNKITRIKRQNLNAIGEAVGILIRDDCENCLIKDNLIDKKDGIEEANSYGIWNTGLEKVVIVKNKIIGFKYGILNNSGNYKIIFNEIICSNQKEDFGLVLYNNSQIQDIKIIQQSNDISSCTYPNFTCITMDSNDCSNWLSESN